MRVGGMERRKEKGAMIITKSAPGFAFWELLTNVPMTAAPVGGIKPTARMLVGAGTRPSHLSLFWLAAKQVGCRL